ncbi:MAG: ABC transporter ATP-binding protein [Chloroflexaceae bacterium]
MQIHIHNLTKTFGPLRANNAISLEFAAGQIHGVLGENGAGKSTLMKLLSGFLRRDAGEVRLDGRPVRLASPAEALRAGVGMIHQDPLDVPAFTALENFYCASPRAAMPSLTAARRMLFELAERLEFTVAPDSPVSGLTMGQRQQLEIMRLLACGARVLILDEPTTGITAAQAVALFAALRRLAAEGKTVLFVSHKLDEVAALCQTVSVLRAGRVVGTQMPVPQPHERLLTMMFGPAQPEPDAGAAAATPVEQPPVPAAVPPVWQLTDITLRQGALTLSNLTLEIRAGTVLGLAGLEGSGQQLLLRLLAGQLRPPSGQLRLNGVDMTGVSMPAMRAAGVHFLPADRLAEGLVGAFSLTDHAALLNRSRVLLDRRAAVAEARTAIANYDIRATPTTPIEALSGGNQQRALLALLPEWCAGLLMEQPTRGLDVTSAHAVWQRLLARRNAGTALVFASAELDELLEYSDYIVVFFAGRVSRPLARSELSETRLAELIGGIGFEDARSSRTDAA